MILLYFCSSMQKKIIIPALFFVFSLMNFNAVQAQCSVCTKTVEQMGEKPAKALNGAILYLMFTPFAIAGFVGYRWWKSNKNAS